MQTFLPYPDFAQSARVLDNKRLGKQRVEVLQILNVLIGTNSSTGWRNHPAVRMWRGYEGCLSTYGLAICDEWIRRGYKDTCKEKITALVGHLGVDFFKRPIWCESLELHASHRSNLLRKDVKWYSKFDWTEPDNLPYVWPV